MITKEVTIKNRAGLHTRPSSMLVREAARFKSDFFINKDGIEINGKSIIGVMTLAAEQGAILTLMLDGEDEVEALDSIAKMIEDGFGEAI